LGYCGAEERFLTIWTINQGWVTVVDTVRMETFRIISFSLRESCMDRLIITVPDDILTAIDKLEAKPDSTVEEHTALKASRRLELEDGALSPVGGLSLKAAAASREGLSAFLYPRLAASPGLNAGTIELLEADTLHDALFLWEA